MTDIRYVSEPGTWLLGDRGDEPEHSHLRASSHRSMILSPRHADLLEPRRGATRARSMQHGAVPMSLLPFLPGIES